jgi:hypothetical protein
MFGKHVWTCLTNVLVCLALVELIGRELRQHVFGCLELEVAPTFCHQKTHFLEKFFSHLFWQLLENFTRK